ncbi:MAG: hypothetical protein ABSH31_21385 [Bryobacteraceae bacterium]
MDQGVSWVQFLSNLAGAGIGTTFVGLLFQRMFARELETHKALLARTTNVHARIVDTLAELYRHFVEARDCFQGMTAGARFSGEPSRDEYERTVIGSMQSARETLLRGRLFVPKPLAQQCDRFFAVVFKGRLDFSFAQDPMVDAAQKSSLWQAAATAANQELPKVLEAIENAARAVIHGEPVSDQRRPRNRIQRFSGLFAAILVGVAALSVAYYFGRYQPRANDSELDGQRRKVDLENAQRCNADARKFYSEFVRAHPPISGGWNRDWDEPEMHFSARLNTCLVHIGSVEINRQFPSQTNSVHKSQVVEIYSNRAILYGWFERGQDGIEKLIDPADRTVPNYSSTMYLAERSGSLGSDGWASFERARRLRRA